MATVDRPLLAPDKVVTVQPHTLVTVQTHWTAPCGKVTIFSTNGWDTNFDNLEVDAGGGD